MHLLEMTLQYTVLLTKVAYSNMNQTSVKVMEEITKRIGIN